MSFKEKFSQKILDKSTSYNYFKNNYQNLSNENINAKNDIKRLKEEIKSKQDEINILKRECLDLEEGFIFSIVMAIYNTENYLSEAIESIINQTFDFNKVQLILVDDGSTDKCKEICLEYVEKYPGNIKYIFQENQGQAVARNNGMKLAEGKYVNFLDSDDKLELNALEEVYYHFIKFHNEIDVISIPRYLFGAVNGPMNFHHKFKKNRVIDILEEYDFPQVSISAAFIKKEAFTENFDERVIISEDSLLINSIIIKKCKFGVVGSTRYLYRKRQEQNSTIDTKKIQIDYFNPRMEFYFKKLIENSKELHGYVLKYIQFVLMYDLQWLFLQNTEIGVLSDNESNEFYNHISDVIQEIDDDIILSDSFNLSKFLKYHILNFKYSKPDFKIVSSNDTLLLYKNKEFDILSKYKIKLTKIMIDEDNVVMEGYFKFYPCDLTINAYSDNKLLKISVDKTFEYSMGSVVSVKLNLKINELINDLSKLNFEINLNSNTFVPKIDYSNCKSNIEINIIN